MFCECKRNTDSKCGIQIDSTQSYLDKFDTIMLIPEILDIILDVLFASIQVAKYSGDITNVYLQYGWALLITGVAGTVCFAFKMLLIKNTWRLIPKARLKIKDDPNITLKQIRSGQIHINEMKLNITMFDLITFGVEDIWQLYIKIIFFIIEQQSLLSVLMMTSGLFLALWKVSSIAMIVLQKESATDDQVEDSLQNIFGDPEYDPE